MRIKGLMLMAPFLGTPEDARPHFRSLRLLLDEFNKQVVNEKEKLNILSMGMSWDYRVALQEGATMLRIGRAIFGERRQ